MTNIAATKPGAQTVEQPTARHDALAFGDPLGPSVAHRRRVGLGALSTRSIGGFLWTVAGVLTAVLTLGWVLRYGPHPLLGSGDLAKTVNCWLNPPAYAAALAAWGCFRRASRR